MNIDKCRTCKNFNDFFCACNLFTIEMYDFEGDFYDQVVPIKMVKLDECEYEVK